MYVNVAQACWSRRVTSVDVTSLEEQRVELLERRQSPDSHPYSPTKGGRKGGRQSMELRRYTTHMCNQLLQPWGAHICALIAVPGMWSLAHRSLCTDMWWEGVTGTGITCMIIRRACLHTDRVIPFSAYHSFLTGAHAFVLRLSVWMTSLLHKGLRNYIHL